MCVHDADVRLVASSVPVLGPETVTGATWAKVSPREGYCEKGRCHLGIVKRGGGAGRGVCWTPGACGAPCATRSNGSGQGLHVYALTLTAHSAHRVLHNAARPVRLRWLERAASHSVDTCVYIYIYIYMYVCICI